MGRAPNARRARRIELSTTRDTAMVKAIETEEEFKHVITSGKLVIIDFHAQWCGPCKAIAPAVQAFSEQYTDAVFVKIDVDELEAIAEDFDISAMPTFVAVKGAKEVGRVMGANKDAIEGLVKQHL